MADRLLVWGGGGHGKVIADVIRLSGSTVCGFVDRDPDKQGMIVEPGGGRVLLDDATLILLMQEGRALPGNATYVAVAIGDNRARANCARMLGGRLASPLVHPTATISVSTTVGQGSVVFAGAVINASARIGVGVIINTGAIVEHDCVVADGAHVSPNATLAGGVAVGDYAWVGAGAVVIPGVSIGVGAIVGAGAVVRRDVPDGATVIGNPARILSPASE